MTVRETLRAVDKVLAQVWDPIGTVSSGGPTDEYSSYAPRVLGLLQRGATDDEVAAHLAHLETDELGVATTAAHRLPVARELRTTYVAAAS